MLTNITEEELNFMFNFYNPIALAECLFSDFDNLGVFDENLGHIRLSNISLLSYQYMMGYNPALSEKENYRIKEGAGNVWCFGGRLFGKTHLVEKIDLLLDMVLEDGDVVGFTSYDSAHIEGILEDIIRVLRHHPFYQMFNPQIKRSPNYTINLRNNWKLESVNMNLRGQNPGDNFYQKHFKKLYIEEASLETEEVYNKRSESVDEKGCVFRVAGMTNFTKHSPAGKVFYDLTKKPWVINLPSYVNPNWDKKREEKAIKDHGGKDSIGYRVFIEGEVVEEGLSVFDMSRVRANYVEKKHIKHFEIRKETYPDFRNIIIVERPINAEVCYIAADIGETAPTEIIIIFKINNKYRYEYNITLYNLTDKQQTKIFVYLAETLNANFIAIECGEGTGRAIYRSLEERFDKSHLVWYDGSMKIPVDFEKDENGRVVFKNGKPVYREEYMSEWSVRRLKTLLYEQKFLIPIDYKFDVQFNSIISMQSGNRTIYECVSENNHLFDSFRVFSIAEWSNEFNLIKPIRKKTYCKTGVV